MSTIKSSTEHLTLNADGSGKDIKFQANGVEKASISSTGAFTSTSIDATKLSGDLPAIDGSSLTGMPAGGTILTINTSVATTSGTSIDLTGIPSGVTKIRVGLDNVRTSGTARLRFQLGVGTTPQTSGYDSSWCYGPGRGVASTAGFESYRDTASVIYTGMFEMTKIHATDNEWAYSSDISTSQGYTNSNSGIVTLSGELGMIRLTTVNGTDSYNLGSASLSWEI